MRLECEWFGVERRSLLVLGQILQIDPKLLALLIEMAALKSQRFCCLSYVAAMPIKLGQYRLPLECQYSLSKRSGGIALGHPCLGSSGF